MENNKIEVTEIVLEKEMMYKKTPVLKYSIKYPSFTSSKSQYFINRLNQYYQNQAYSLVKYCEGKLFREAAQLYNDSIANNFPIHKYEFVSAYTVTFNQNYVFSLYFDQYQYTGGANGTTFRTSKSWNVKTRREINLNDLFPGKRPLNAYIEAIVIKQIDEQIKENPNESNYFDDYKKLVVQYFNPNNFYLTTDAVNFYFQEITIAPHSSGIPVFEIPYQENNIIQQDADNTVNPYKTKSELLMNATDEVGVFSPKDAVDVWASGLKKRSGAMQYIVMTKKYKESYAEMLDKNNLNWVTGISSPWVEGYNIINHENLKDGSVLFELKFNTATSAGFWGSYNSKLTVIQEDGFWRIKNIQADKELYVYMGINLVKKA